jgi:hypothetical protein
MAKKSFISFLSIKIFVYYIKMLIRIVAILLFFIISYFIVREVSMLKDKKARPLLDFRQTVCFGQCPAFSATIYMDGMVSYNGESDVIVPGPLNFKLSEGLVQDIDRRIHGLDVSGLEEEYDGPVTDLPTTFLTIYLPDSDIRKIRSRYGAPKKLSDFIKYIADTILSESLNKKI